MLSLLRNVGPLSVAVDARNWQNYQGGIIKYHCPSNLNHAVTIVGYDQTGKFTVSNHNVTFKLLMPISIS